MADKQNHKLSDEDFLTILRENFGLFELTSQAIQKQYGITYSRQSVRERAQKYATEFYEMQEDMFDCGKSKIVACMQGDVIEPAQLRAANNVLNTIGKFINRKKPGPPKPEQVYNLDG